MAFNLYVHAPINLLTFDPWCFDLDLTEDSRSNKSGSSSRSYELGKQIKRMNIAENFNKKIMTGFAILSKITEVKTAAEFIHWTRHQC